MFCPSCRAEYVAGIEQCADCEVALVHELPERSGSTEGTIDWVKLAEVTDPVEAELMHGFLESQGIPCEIESLAFRAEPVLFGPLSRVRLHVPRDEADRARALLAERQEGPTPTEEVASANDRG